MTRLPHDMGTTLTQLEERRHRGPDKPGPPLWCGHTVSQAYGCCRACLMRDIKKLRKRIRKLERNSK